jgi:hypothetical protein
MFRAEDELYIETICGDCTESVKTLLKHDRSLQDEMFTVIRGDSTLKFEFLESAIDDEKVLTRLAKCMLKIPAKDIGLGGPGSLAEFFRT